MAALRSEISCSLRRYHIDLSGRGAGGSRLGYKLRNRLKWRSCIALVVSEGDKTGWVSLRLLV